MHHPSNVKIEDDKRDDDVDDWSRYADDPDMVTVKSREERRRLSRVAASIPSRNEQQTENARKAFSLHRRIWDKLYLIGLGLSLIFGVNQFDRVYTVCSLGLMSLSASIAAIRRADDSGFFSILAKIATVPPVAKVAPTETKERQQAALKANEIPQETHSHDKKTVKWRCVACGRENEEALHNNTNVETVIHQVSTEENERVYATFKKSACRPLCSRCSTPIDYGPRPSNKSKFLPPTGDGLRATAILRDNNNRREVRDDATRAYVREMLSKVKGEKRTKRKRSDAMMLFKDWEFDRNVKKFRPVPKRRIGDVYEAGDKVESYCHFPTWYPATVLSRNQNGSYVLKFDNGEINHAVGNKLIRYRIERTISPLQRTFSAALLSLCIVWPVYLALVAHKRLVAVPLVVFASILLIALLVQFGVIVARDGSGGFVFMTKLVVFWCGPPFFLLIFSILCVSSAAPNPFVVTASFGIFYIDASLVATAIKPVCKYLFVSAGVPLCLFAVLHSLWSTRTLTFSTPHLVFLPMYVFYLELWWLHRNLPLLAAT